MKNLLVLLIGSNPLPNYVVALYLLNRDRSDSIKIPVPDKILFVCSHDTELFLAKIVEQLALEQGRYDRILLGNDEVRSHGEIRKKIESELDVSLQKNKQRFRSIHINYTGGTKPMAVGSFEAVRNYCFMKDEDTAFISSDLNPWNFKLVLLDGQQFPVTGDLRDSVSLNVNSILKLHDIQVCSSSKVHTTLFSNWQENRGLNFHEWGEQKFLKELEESAFANLHNKKLGFIKKWLKSPENVDKIGKSRSILDRYSMQFISLDDKDAETWEIASKFLASGYLEELVFECLTRMRVDLRLSDIVYDLKGSLSSRDIQIDVVASRGYQLFLFSCTTEDDLYRIKHRAFEVNYRAVQLGGEHAKSVIVCLGSEETCFGVKNDMSQFDAARNFDIIGGKESIYQEALENRIRGIIS